MDQSKETESLTHLKSIPQPDLRNFRAVKKLVETAITTPLAGFQDLTHRDGTPLNEQEQLKASRKQFIEDAKEMLLRGATLEDISKKLEKITAYELPKP
ncbi:hypothetical protein M1437_01365 [Patescibacteria group bacterium]|nr:hypothetical protein [Patescibacteria group bacterium]